VILNQFIGEYKKEDNTANFSLIAPQPSSSITPWKTLSTTLMPDDSSFLPYKNFIVILIPKPFNLSPLQSNGEYENVLGTLLAGIAYPLSSYHFCQLFDGSIWFDFTLLAFLNCTYSKLLANRLTRGTIQVGLFSTICAAMGGLIAFPPIPTFVLCL